MLKIEIFGVPYLKEGSGIHIKKKNRGKFTEYCGGKVTDECIQKAKKSKNPKLRKRATFAANARKWKHKQGGIIKYQEGTTEGGINTFNPPKMIITEELKELKKTNPQEYSKTMQTMMRQNQRDYAKAWYAERYKQDKYKDQLQGNMDKINDLLDQDGYVSSNDISTKLGGKKAVSETGQPLLGGFVSGDLSVDRNPFWFGTSKGSWWHEGIGHWLGDQIPGLLTKYPTTYMKYTGPFQNGQYQNYINKQNENHAQTWEFRGLNKDLKDANGNLYIDPNRQLTPEDIEEMKKDPRFKIPQNWQNTNIDAKGIADFHNTFAFVNKRPVPGFPESPVKQLAKEGAKIHKPNGHRSVLDNGWIPTKRLKKGTYGLIKKRKADK